MAKKAKKKPAAKQPKRPKIGARESAQIGEVLDYRRQGHGLDVIAAEMKITVERVQDLLSKGLTQITHGSQKENLLLDIARVNEMMASQYPAAAGGDPIAIGHVTSLIDRRTKLEEKLSAFNADFFTAIKATHMGRPPHMPTYDSRLIVEAFAWENVPHETIANHLHIDVNTLKKHYMDELTDAKGKLSVEFRSWLVDKWRRQDNLTAGIFFAKTQLRWQEYREPGWAGGADASGRPAGADDGCPPGVFRVEGGLPEPGHLPLNGHGSNGTGSPGAEGDGNGQA